MVDQVTRVEVAFDGDTTGSMRPCIAEVRRKVEASFTKLFKEIPELRIAVGANGDYCDNGSTYVTSWHDFSSNIHDLCQFVRNVKNTGGGDLPECYELVLHEARKLNWSHNARKVFILAADDIPHPPHNSENIRYNGKGLDWRHEADELAKMGVAVYAVQCLSKSYATPFYRELAERTGGYHFTLDQFSEVTELIMAICLKQGDQANFKRWEDEVAKSGHMTRSMDENLAKLSGRSIHERFRRAPKSLDAVLPGRFQILGVDRDIKIQDFARENGLIFATGRGFYEFTKSEIIREENEVVLRDKLTGDMFSGSKTRDMIGVPLGTRGRAKPAHFDKYDVFVQSKSYTRKLIGGTRFLYEVDLSR